MVSAVEYARLSAHETSDRSRRARDSVYFWCCVRHGHRERGAPSCLAPSLTTQIFIGLLLGVAGRLLLARGRQGHQAAGRRVPADDQDDHRAAALLDAGGRHRRHRRPEGDGAHRPEGDHLFRGRHHDRAVLGLALVNIFQPGAGLPRRSAPTPATGGAAANQQHAWDIFLHLFPTSVIDAMARGDILQMVVFATFFGIALAAIGAKGQPVLDVLEPPRRRCSSSPAT